MDAINQIQWKDILLVLMGSGVTICVFLFKIVQDYLKRYKLVTPLLGTWHTYHFSRTGYHSILRKEKWKIQRRLTGLTIQTFDDEMPDLQYKGRVSFDSGHVAMHLQGIKHHEIIQYRLNQPVPNEDTMMLGFYTGKDFDHELFSSMKLVCQKERTDDEAKNILYSSIEWFQDECCIRFSKQPVKANKKNPADHKKRGG